ncbi:oxidoreductase [Rapidithrix thailandica]|uniref:Oxidoreductase n=1 Tax=Rapidithrix thailandica TaxID=413964 RepID=A0AAW9S9S1_9BACT
MNHEKKVQVGFAAFGMSGQVFHGPLVHMHPNLQIHTIVERSKTLSQAFYPEAQVLRSFEEMLAQPGLDLVIINTPDYLHYAQTKAALEAGKHVVVEKPFVLHSEEGAELMALAQNKNLLLSVFHNRRWDSDFLTVQKVIQNQLLGRTVEYEAHFDRYRNFIKEGTWKEQAGEGSILYNLGSHLIDQALVLFGMPLSVTAKKGIQRTGGKVDDYFHLTLQYPDFHAILRSSYLVREEMPKFIVHGTEGSFVKYGMDPQEEALKQGRLPNEADWGKEPEHLHGTLNTSTKGLHFRGKIESLPGNYATYYDTIYESIVHHSSLAVTAQEALNVIKVIEAAIQSTETQQTILL